jgi:ribonuclease G
MSEEILINVTPQETRVAVVENGVLQEVHLERARSRGLVGNIYKWTSSKTMAEALARRVVTSRTRRQ